MRIALALGLAVLTAGVGIEAQSRARGATRPPAGTKVATGRHFEITVAALDSHELTPGITSRAFNVLAVAHTQTHGIQQITRRVTTINANLLDAASWEIIDFDKDGWDDYRYNSGITEKGCRTWEAERWEPDHDRFTSAPTFAKWTDARGQPIQGNCIGK